MCETSAWNIKKMWLISNRSFRFLFRHCIRHVCLHLWCGNENCGTYHFTPEGRTSSVSMFVLWRTKLDPLKLKLHFGWMTLQRQNNFQNCTDTPSTELFLFFFVLFKSLFCFTVKCTYVLNRRSFYYQQFHFQFLKINIPNWKTECKMVSHWYLTT